MTRMPLDPDWVAESWAGVFLENLVNHNPPPPRFF